MRGARPKQGGLRTKDQERDHKRRVRAIWYAKGLSSDGKALVRPEWANRLRRFGPHHGLCLCIDCLFTHDAVLRKYRPRVPRSDA